MSLKIFVVKKLSKKICLGEMYLKKLSKLLCLKIQFILKRCCLKTAVPASETLPSHSMVKDLTQQETFSLSSDGDRKSRKVSYSNKSGKRPFAEYDFSKI